MDNFEIDDFLLNHPKTNKIFIGCYAADKIPQTDIYPYAAIINTDKSGYPGTHWVAIYVQNSKVIEYFDSFGDPPNSMIGNYLLNFEHIHRNQSVIQSVLSKNCGQYCIYFIFKRCTRTPFKCILNKLLKLKDPNIYVKSFVDALRKV